MNFVVTSIIYIKTPRMQYAHAFFPAFSIHSQPTSGVHIQSMLAGADNKNGRSICSCLAYQISTSPFFIRFSLISRYFFSSCMFLIFCFNSSISILTL